MTVPATARKAGPFTGTGVSVPYPFSFKIFATTDVQLIQADTLGNTTVLSSGYSVTMNPDQAALPGGSVTLTTALPTDYKLTILGNLPYDQTLSIPGGGNFDPVSLEKELDRTIMQVQQIAERNARAVSSAATDSLSSSELPGAVATNIIGWDPTGTKLQNYSASSFAIASANWSTSAFNGDGVTVSFVLPTDAGVASNCAVSVGGVVQAAGINFNYTQATKTITFLTGAPPVGTNNVVVRYGVAVPQGVASEVAITGGSIDGTPIGATTPTAGYFTNLNGLPTKKRTAVIYGDSITARNFAVSSSYNSYADNGYFNWANAYLGQRFELLNNAGVAGEGTTAILARIQTGVINYSPGFCFVLGGYNDIATGVPSTTTISNLQTIYQTLIGRNITVIALAITPSNQFTTATMREAVANINAWMRNYCLRNSGIIFVDTYTPLLDPTSSAGAGITGYFVDGIHPTTSGAQIMGQAIYNAVNALVPSTGMLECISDAASSTFAYGNILSNPVMQGSGGSAGAGFSGTISANWVTLIENGTVTVVCSKVARTDFQNFTWQQMAITDTAGVGVVDLYQEPAKPSVISTGDVVYGQGELNLTAFATTTISRLKVSITALDSGHTPVASVINNCIAMGNNDGNIAIGNYILKTPPLTVPAGTAFFNFTAQITLAGAGTATFQIGRCELRKVYP